MKNYYQILGLESNASKEDIKKAYRTYAAKFHPDKQNGDKFFEERFKEILEAYEILSDDLKRANYDTKRTNEYSKGASAYNRQTESDQDREREQKKRREKEREESDRSEKIKARRNQIFYTSKNISVNGMYIYTDGKSYLLDKYDLATLKKDDNSMSVFAGIVLIIIGILTIPLIFGVFLLVMGISGLFYKEYFIVLVNEHGETLLIKGKKQRIKLIVNQINKAIDTKNQYTT
ncbi:MAG: DnaJ domain-containing protein [Prolixibacteraceae bacterium]|nr:DnaJ domain-containing protein [Prolixibacteraceae bacterium]